MDYDRVCKFKGGWPEWDVSLALTGSSKDMEELFDPVVAMIIDLIKDQIHNSDRTGGNGQIQVYCVSV